MVLSKDTTKSKEHRKIFKGKGKAKAYRRCWEMSWRKGLW